MLNGPSRAVDHSHEAARRDLADIALAGRWFAPHYAVPKPLRVIADTDLLTAAGHKAETIMRLSPDEGFAALEISGGYAWGYRQQDRRVGYVDVSALA